MHSQGCGFSRLKWLFQLYFTFSRLRCVCTVCVSVFIWHCGEPNQEARSRCGDTPPQWRWKRCCTQFFNNPVYCVGNFFWWTHTHTHTCACVSTTGSISAMCQNIYRPYCGHSLIYHIMSFLFSTSILFGSLSIIVVYNVITTPDECTVVCSTACKTHGSREEGQRLPVNGAPNLVLKPGWGSG